MQDIARRTLDAWHRSSASQSRGLVALSFDMPNHGSRLVSELANHAWDKGNEKHAIDMAGIVKGGVSDMSGLMDLVGGYLGRDVDAHVCLGWSLGGHSAWWSWFGEERIDAAVVIVGCPDYLSMLACSPAVTSANLPDLMCNRAKRSNLDTKNEDLLGSKYFPRDLLSTCQSHDPKSILFGANGSAVPSLPLSSSERARLRGIFNARIRGKKVLACSGGDDKLVPYARGEPFLAVVKDAVEGWYKDGEVVVDDRVYEGVGHKFSADMVRDAVEFLVRVVAEGPRRRRRAKI